MHVFSDDVAILSQESPIDFTTDDCLRTTFEEVFGEYAAARPRPQDPMRILHFVHLLGAALHLETGHYAEVGTAGGVSARVIRRLMDPRMRLYCFDTFTGFDERDVRRERELSNNFHWWDGLGLFSGVSPEEALKTICRGEGSDQVVLRVGWFPETFRGLEPLRWRFVHIDTDLYAPTLSALRVFWPNVVRNGMLVVHDYGNAHFPGVRKAVDDFVRHHCCAAPIRLMDFWCSALIVKTSSHESPPPSEARSLVT